MYLSHPLVLVAVLLLAAGRLVSQTPITVSSALRNGWMLPALVFDQARQRLVCVLGNGEISEWDGETWARPAARFPIPAFNTSIGAFYDAVRARVVGIVSANGGWTAYDYDGHAVVMRGPAPGPGPFAVDSHRNRLVAVGSGPGGTTTIEWDGNTWQQVATGGPPWCLPYSIAYDPVRRATLFLGWPIYSYPTPPTQRTETWEWNGTRWKLATTSRRVSGTLIYDHLRQRRLAIGASPRAWNGTAWSQLSATPVSASPGQIAEDPVAGLVFAYDRNELHEIRSFDGTSWAAAAGTPHPERYEAPFTFDTWRSRAVVFGGNNGMRMYGDLREWDGHRWSSPSPGPGPGPRLAHAQVFDSLRGETIILGGYDGFGSSGQHLADAWAWNGTTWRQLANLPAPRSNQGVAYDSQRDRVIVLGGAAAGVMHSDHWEWDGVVWQQRGSVPFSPTRATSYDPVRQRLVVSTLSATWEFDGTAWSQHSSYIWPPPNLCWNGASQRVEGTLLVGMNSSVWAWDGTTWTQGPPGTGAIAHDPSRNVRLFFLGVQLALSGAALATSADFGSACSSSPGSPSLTTFGRPRLGNSTFHLDLRARAEPLPALICYATSIGSVPLPGGCTLLLHDPFVPQLVLTGPAGFVHQPLPLPTLPSLRGSILLAQAAVLDPTEPAGYSLTQGLRLVLGD